MVTSASCSSAGKARPITSPIGLCTMSEWSKTACMTATSLIEPTTSRPRITGSCEISKRRSMSSASFTGCISVTVISGGSGCLARSTSPTVSLRRSSSRKPLARIHSSLKIFVM